MTTSVMANCTVQVDEKGLPSYREPHFICPHTNLEPAPTGVPAPSSLEPTLRLDSLGLSLLPCRGLLQLLHPSLTSL